MSDVRGSNTRVVAVPETVFKTPGTDGERLYFTQFTVKPDQQRDNSQTLSGYRGQSRSAEGLRNVSGQIGHELAPETAGLLLKNLIGAPTTSGAGPYTHVFQAANSGANALPIGLTFEEDFGTAIASASRYLQLRGCRFNQGTFTFGPSGFQTLQVDVLGSDWLKTNTALDATPTDPGHIPFTAAELAVRLGPSGSPKSVCFNQLTLNWGNDLDPDKYCISGGGVRDGLGEGFAIVGGSVVAFFDHADVIDTILSGADTELAITLSRGDGLGTAGNESLVIAIPNLVFSRTGPDISGPRGLRLQANFTVHRTTGELGATFTLKNAQATLT